MRFISEIFGCTPSITYRLHKFGGCAEPCPDPANFNRDHCVNSQGFFDFLAAFLAGC
ncbi:MAG: hypothetical protein AB7G11_11650 [Phycisphaerales bacterium]